MNIFKPDQLLCIWLPIIIAYSIIYFQYFTMNIFKPGWLLCIWLPILLAYSIIFPVFYNFICLHFSFLDDTYTAVMTGYNSKKKTIERLKEELAKNERELAEILAKHDSSNNRLTVSTVYYLWCWITEGEISRGKKQRTDLCRKRKTKKKTKNNRKNIEHWSCSFRVKVNIFFFFVEAVLCCVFVFFLLLLLLFCLVYFCKL